ncbi:rubredoxin domain-containing protein [Ohtaekwangia koreensis]|uniref:Rubredoxin n=1 Tax=Ohtaekwangia koreensis TaxID=688867 RepID=A0A1T5MGI0_9BACT|nr:rubredoxin domain-containing protein [Ohtaekwangia koreensis]SKC87322.1 Rubredoxin [Ohtaekwangia koreensis]
METKKSDLIRAFVKGGILSPADLLKIMEISQSLDNKFVLFGSRQDIMFPSNGADEKKIDYAFRDIHIDYELGSDQSIYQNIVSSYIAVNVVETTNWVKEDTYHFVIDNFDYKPKIKINIVDPVQSIVPLFTGELNFIASREDNYWYLYIRDPRKGNIVECWPKLIFSHDIAKVSKALEELILNFQPFGMDELFVILQGKMRINYRVISEKLKYPDSTFPYYEGLNAMLNNQYWLGLYWRNNQYDIDFMSAASKLCQETNVGKINIIPWKAFIIKGIKASDRIRWEKLMGKFGINGRHSSLELNWHLPVIDAEALELKRFLVRELDQQDISTHGLTFTIKTKHDSFLFTSIVIERNTSLENTERYNILYAKDFNPNKIAYLTYARDVKKEIIPALLIELSKMYYRQLNPEREKQTEKNKEEKSGIVVSSYQCSNCLSIYDQRYGDATVNIPPGVPFDELPETYRCHVCNSPKMYFTAMTISAKV